MNFLLSIYGGVTEHTSTCIISFQNQNRADTWLKILALMKMQMPVFCVLMQHSEAAVPINSLKFIFGDGR